MASIQRSIRRSMMFAGMNKQQRRLWDSEHGGKNDARKHAYRKISRKTVK